MNIPRIITNTHQGLIGSGPKNGQTKYFHDAIASCLAYLKPKNCLEIGTHRGESAYAFVNNFDGQLITADIKVYIKLNHPRIKQIQIHPYDDSYKNFHYVEELDILPSYKEDKNPAWTNFAKIFHFADLHKMHPFDFVLIDGDHQAKSLEKDIEVCKALTKPPHYMLIDDIWAFDQECGPYYHTNIIQRFNHYEFEDWEVTAGCGLIWCR